MGMLFLIALAAVVLALIYYFGVNRYMNRMTPRDRELRRQRQREGEANRSPLR